MSKAIEKCRVGDIDIAFRWDGKSDGPVVMMAHAMGTSHRIWDSWFHLNILILLIFFGMYFTCEQLCKHFRGKVTYINM